MSGASRGGAEGTGDDSVETCRPADPDEPHDEVEGTRVEAVETAMLEALRGIQEDPGKVVDEDCRPGMPDEPPDKPDGAPHDPEYVQVEPGGETAVERDGSAAHECADAAADDRAEEAHGAVQDEAERSATCLNALIEGERGSALAQGRLTTTDEPDNQRSETSVDNIPRAPPEPPPPVHTPDKPTHRKNEPPSVKLEGERCTSASFDIRLTSTETNASGASRHDEDARNRPKAAQNASERERGRPNGRTREYSPEGGRDDRGDPRGEAHASPVPGSIEDIGKRPKKPKNALERIRGRYQWRTGAPK